MKTSYSIFLFLLLTVSQIFAQNYQPGKLWVSVLSDEARETDENYTKNNELNELLSQFNVSSYNQVMWFAKTPSLRDIYEIDCQCNEAELKDILESHFANLFSFVEQIPILVQAYEPEDYMWTDHQDWIWHLPKIQADSAWDITIGNPQIRIGIIEEGIDIEHPDLAFQTFPYYDPYSGEEFNSLNLFKYNLFHGTTVASFAAARTAETGTNPSPNGQLASIGFNSKLIGYDGLGMPRVLHASTVMGADVVNCSWMSMGSISPSLDSINEKVIKEVTGNGTVIVAAAGNGFCSTWYNDTENWFFCDSVPLDFDYFSAPYPFNPKYDSTIILVTSTDSLDNHTLYGDTIVNRTHSHYPEVDICSPGHNIMGATLTYEVDTISGDTVKKEWPYYGSFSGTSFATPIVSGVCALIKSINPCLTPAQVEEIIKLTADPVNDENHYPGLLGAGRINAYHAVKYAQDNYGYDEFIIHNGQDTTWQTDLQAKKITIESGGKLTIKSTVYMLPGSDIIIETGGHLIIDSGYVTTCKGLWNGIRVHGNRNLDQYTFSNQGHVSLINNATIENALVGVQTIKIDSAGMDLNGTGGIVHVNHANFLNCVNGICFYPYENYLNDTNNVKNNLSYLYFCNFKLDSNYYHVFSSPKQFVYMESVRGIPIKACNFINEMKATDYEDETLIDPENMVGITSINSSFIVDEYCLHHVTPCDTLVPSYFENLKYGIYALNFGSEKFPVINKSEFYRNKTGVYLGAINNAVVTSNYFYPESIDTTGLDPLILGGLYLDNCNAYEIEENEFVAGNSSPISTGVKVGLVVNNSGPYANEVYKNDFTHLDYGVIAMNNNKRDSVGLCIKCNDFAYCDYDISVVVEPSSKGWGIASNQGSRDTIPTAPAGNIFTSNFSNHVFDLYNDDDADPFTYFHHIEVQYMTPNLEPDFYSQSVYPTLNSQWYDPDESCPSHLGGGGGSLLEKSIMLNAENHATSIEESLLSLIDGGNTDDLNADVLSSLPLDALDLTNQLLNESPYLSDTVLKSAIIKEDVLTNSMIRDVLVGNPQSAKSEDIMQMVDERLNPMPDYMKNQIEQGKFTTGDKENLEARQSFYLSEQARAFNNLNRIYQTDTTISYGLDSLTNLFDEMDFPENRYRKAFATLENGNYIESYNILNSLPDVFPLNTEQSAIHQKFEELFEVLVNMQAALNSVQNLDSAQIADLLDIYDSETIPGIYARNILVAAGYLSYQEPYQFPKNLKRMGMKPGSKIINDSELATLKIFPNPANSYTIIEYDLGNDENLASIIPEVSINIKDVRGITLKQLTSVNQKDQLVLDVRDLKPGLYLLYLNCNGQRITISKLIVNK
jgi:subtilisin family serine protease